jgi:hypothetical protein
VHIWCDFLGKQDNEAASLSVAQCGAALEGALNSSLRGFAPRLDAWDEYQLNVWEVLLCQGAKVFEEVRCADGCVHAA